MTYQILLHPDVIKYLDSISEKSRKKCYQILKKLSDDPFKSRSGCDIKKMSGKKIYYRLRVGDHRFLYVVHNKSVLVEEGFKREKGY